MGALVIDGVGLYLGAVAGLGPVRDHGHSRRSSAPCVIALFLAMSLLPRDFDRLVAARAARRRASPARVARRLATVPSAAATGIRTAIALVRSGDPGLLGAVAWWGFDIATLWACFHAFGYAPHKGVIVMAYFVGWIANTLPLPGGIGGVEGGLIGAFTAFGVNVQARRRRRARLPRVLVLAADDPGRRSPTSSCADRAPLGGGAMPPAQPARAGSSREPPYT